MPRGVDWDNFPNKFDHHGVDREQLRNQHKGHYDEGYEYPDNHDEDDLLEHKGNHHGGYGGGADMEPGLPGWGRRPGMMGPDYDEQDNQE